MQIIMITSQETIFPLVVLATMLVNGQPDTCPERCYCGVKNGIYDCRSAGLITFPWNMPSPTSAKELLLSSNTIVRIDPLSLMLYKNIIKLDMTKCKLSEIDEKTFENVKNLTELRFADNSITNIGLKTFQGLTQLKYLDLSGNGITKLPSNMFADCSKLTTLDLSRNSIEKIEKNAFLGLISLESLDLSSNQLSGVPVDSLSTLPSLRAISLGGNMLSNIPSHAFRSLRNLQKLQLHDNRIAEISDLAFHGKDSVELPKLKYLSLRANHLTTIPIEAIQNLSSLMTLDLSDNLITTIAADSFIGLSRLRTISLNEMSQLTSVAPYAFASLTDLEELQMHRNKELTNLGSMTLGRLPGLRVLDLCCNGLTTIDESVLEQWDQLDRFDLRLNPWNCDCNLAWLGSYLRNHSAGYLLNTVKCFTPVDLAQQPLMSVDNFQCSSSGVTTLEANTGRLSKVMWILIICVLVAIVLVLGGLLLYKFRRTFKHCRNQMRYRAQEDSGMDALSSTLSVA